MNDKDLQEKLTKTQKQIDVASEIYQYTIDLAKKVVDEHLPSYQEQIKLAILPDEKNERIMARNEAVSVAVAVLLQLSGEIRV